MRRWILWITIILVLAAGGFCIYWFIFRDTSDGGDLTNKEVLFAIQSVLEDQQIDLDNIVKDHQNVSFTYEAKTEAVVSADSKVLTVGEKFENILTTTESKVSLNAEQFKNNFAKPLIYAYSALYENVFNNAKFKQNVWYSQTITQKIDEENSVDRTYKLKVLSLNNNKICLWFYDEANLTFNEMTLQFNYRNETNVYSLENKITKTNKDAIAGESEATDSYSYQYAYFNRDAENILNFESIDFTSEERVTNIQKNYSYLDFNINSIYLYGEQIKAYLNPESIADLDGVKAEMQRYLLDNLDVNFYEEDKYLNAKTTSIDTFTNAYKYYN